MDHKAEIKWTIFRSTEAETKRNPGGLKWTIKRKLSGLFFGALKPRQTETQADQSGTLKVETKWTKVEHWS